MTHLFPEPIYLSPRPKKKPEPKPKDGKDGIDGKDGRDGIDGKDGKDGRNGIDGKDGAPGVKGDKGDPGPAGKDGLNGKDGRDGKDFTPPNALSEVEIESGHLVKHYRDGKAVALKLPKYTRGGGIGAQKAKGIAVAASGDKSIRIASTDTSITSADDILICTAALTVTMPSSGTKLFKIKRSGSGAVTVVPQSGHTIEGESSRVLNVNLYALELFWDGTSNWVEL